jgi:hypothetical protein
VNGASAYFDGNGDYLKNTNNNTDLQFGTGDLTVEFWLYLNQIGVVQYPFDTRQAPNGDGGGIQVAILSNNTMWVDMDGAGITLQTSLTLKANEWTHVALTRASGTWRFFFNGVLNSGTGSDSGNITGGYLSIGTSATRNTADGDDKIKGYMSDVRAVKGTAVYTSAFTPPTAPLTAITNTKLLLNMADGQAIDSAAQNNLTLIADAKISSTQSKFGGTSLYLDGTEDYAVINNSDAWAFGTGDFTVETWLYLNGTPNQYDYIFDMRHSDQTEYTWALSFNYMGTTSDKLQWASNNLSPNAILSADYPPISEWVHIAVCRSGTTLRMFYNGTQSAINTSDSADYRNTGNQGYIGVRHSVIQAKIDAYYDDTRFSKTARYTSNFTPPSEPFADKGQ